MTQIQLASQPPFSRPVGLWNCTFLAVRCVRQPGRASGVSQWCIESLSGPKTKRQDRSERLGSGQSGGREAPARGKQQQVIYRPRYRGKHPDIGNTRYRYIMILQTHRARHRCFLDTTSVYPDIDRDIGTISGMISVKNPISGVARNGYVTILTRYRVRCREKTRYRARYEKYRVWQETGMSRYCHDIGAKNHDIGSDIVKSDTISCYHDTISENAISGHTRYRVTGHHDIGADIVIFGQDRH